MDDNNAFNTHVSGKRRTIIMVGALLSYPAGGQLVLTEDQNY